jgi:endoglucanase
MRRKHTLVRVVVVAAALVVGAVAIPTAHAVTARTEAGIGATSFFQLMAKHSRKCLTVPGETYGDLITQWECADWAASRWRKIPTDSGYFLLVHKQTKKCLAVPGSSDENGVNVVILTCNAQKANQQFKAVRFVPVPAPPQPLYKIVARHSGKCIEVEAAATANGADIQQNVCNVTDHRLWSFV